MSSESRSEYEEKLLEDLKEKFETTKGVRIWGVTETGEVVAVKVTADGKLQCELG